MPNSHDVVHVQVTYALPERVLRWAIAQAQKGTGRNLDHTIAVLIATHKEAQVIEVHARTA